MEGNFNNNNMSGATKPKGHGRGWKIAVAVLAVSLAGVLVLSGVMGVALLSKYLPGNSILSNRTAALTAASQTVPASTAAPGLTAPPLNGASNLSLTQGMNIPAIVKADSPAVVGVLNKVKNQSRNGSTTGDVTQGSGSGVIFREDGYIVTNNHVVEGADSLTVVLPNGEEFPAKLLGADAQTDLAVLKIDKTGLPTIPFGNSDELQVGETVIAIGNPGTPDGEELNGTVTAGIVSAKNRQIQNDGYTYNLLQTDAAINPGNSGGALVNSKGQLVGINNMKITTSEVDEYGNAISAEGLGFAIPVNVAQPIITQLMNGSIQRPILGITVVEVSKAEASTNMIDPGVYIQSLAQNGPAMKAGLQAGDMLEEIGNAKITTTAQIHDVLAQYKVGDTVNVKVYRTNDKQEHTIKVTLGNSADINS